MWSLAVGLGAGLGAEPPLKPGGGAQPFPRAASVREGTHPVMGGHVLPWGDTSCHGDAFCHVAHVLTWGQHPIAGRG